MPLNPDETHVMPPVQGEKPPPQVGIFLVFESFALPAEDPSLRNGIDHIFRVRINRYVAAVVFERFEPGDDRHQLHPVVGRMRIAAAEFLAVRAAHQYDAVTARAGIPQRRTVGIHSNCRHCPFSSLYECYRAAGTKKEGIPPSLPFYSGIAHLVSPAPVLRLLTGPGVCPETP